MKTNNETYAYKLTWLPKRLGVAIGHARCDARCEIKEDPTVFLVDAITFYAFSNRQPTASDACDGKFKCPACNGTGYIVPTEQAQAEAIKQIKEFGIDLTVTQPMVNKARSEIAAMTEMLKHGSAPSNADQ